MIKIERCRVCGSSSLKPCISLGDQYLSSIFPSDLDYRAKLEKLPLNLVLCEGECGLVQLAHRFDLSGMYDAYPYLSGTNGAMVNALNDVARAGSLFVEPGDMILDIGCNDGTLLSFFKDEKCSLIGIDPSNVEFKLPQATHIREYFSKKSFLSASPKKADLILSIAMFYHLDDPVSFAEEVRDCMASDGVWIIQMAYLPTMLRRNMYDNIVHEHAGYYGLRQMKYIMEKVGLQIFDVEKNNVYGGSFRLYIQHKTKYSHYNYRCMDMLSKEDGLEDIETYVGFMQRIEENREELLRLCNGLHCEGQSVFGYGASTKGNTILQYCGLSSEVIQGVADASTFKIGKFLIGSDIRICDEETMREAEPDFLLSLPYSFTSAFREREKKLAQKGTKFIIPLPKVHMV
jgi:SAM-dependent methyltransferase